MWGLYACCNEWYGLYARACAYDTYVYVCVVCVRVLCVVCVRKFFVCVGAGGLKVCAYTRVRTIGMSCLDVSYGRACTMRKLDKSRLKTISGKL